MNQKQVADDIQRHFCNRLRMLITDVAETCDIADLPVMVIVKIIMAGLLSELVAAADFVKLNKEDFTDICNTAFKQPRTLTRHKR